jgi:tetratricopeptide (TPR) repeat protein
MKAQRRHELQHNTLDTEIRKLWEFLRRRGNLILWVAVGVLAVVVAIWYFGKRSHVEAADIQTKFERCIQMPPSEQRDQGLEEVAAKTSYPFWASQALVGLGDSAALRLMEQWPNTTIGDAERLELRRQAEAYYRKAISDFPKEELGIAKAHFALGKLAESWGEMDQAKQEYEAVLRDAQTSQALKGQPVLYLAQDSLSKLPQFQGEVRMPASAPASGPASGPSTGPSSGPSTRGAAAPATSNGSAARPAVPATSAAPASRPASTSVSRGAESN